jgi:riboflavin synthase
MFTGIIRETGVLRGIDAGDAGARVRIEAPRTCDHLAAGSSVAVDGVCLTVTGRDGSSFTADAVPETLRRTRLGGCGVGDRVNLELPVRANQFLDGHLVQGHVDGVGTVESVAADGSQRTVTVRVEPALARYVAEKGSVAMNGVSLTVTAVAPDTFSVALIPFTCEETNLGELVSGSQVNLEVDVVARYAARWAESASWSEARRAP